MDYQELPADEIVQVGREYAALVCWEQAREYAATLYGAVARHLMVVVITQRVAGSRWETRDQVVVLARDAAGERVGYDFSLPWWRERRVSRARIQRFRARDSLDLADNRLLGKACAAMVQDLCERLLGIEALIRWENAAPLTFVYRFDEVPQPSEAVVLVEEEHAVPSSGASS